MHSGGTLIEVVSVIPENDYKFLLSFDTGGLRRLDMKQYFALSSV
jgi:hypothetical protein